MSSQNTMPYHLSFRLFPLLMLASCQLVFPPREKRQEALNQLLQTDADFSVMVREKGYRMAFLEFMEDDAVLLRDNYLPIVGADAVKYLTGLNDTTFSVKWDPQGGDVAESEDLGYTWGVYTITTGATSHKGTYATCWRREKDGRWKVSLYSTTQGADTAPSENIGQ
jgi:ketosteroid isomerase-like protein